MNLTAIQQGIHARVLEYRRLERIVTSKAFEVAYSKGPIDNVIKMIESCACDDLEKWVKTAVADNYGEYSVRQLRQVAIRLGIPNYSFMSKPQLLSAIVERESEQG